MNEAQSDSGEIRPTDPDMKWTGWALDTLRELVAVDMRTKRAISTQQMAAPLGPETPDFDLKQARLSRSVRLSIAMTERIRANYLMRVEKRKESGEQERRRRRREQAVEAAVQAVANPEQDWDVDCVRSAVRERLVEDEILDVQLDTLSAEEFVREVCRKIGRPPPSIPLPQCWDAAAATRTDDGLADHEPAEGWPQAPDESPVGRSLPRPSKPDSS